MKITTFTTKLDGFQIKAVPAEQGSFEVYPGVEVRGMKAPNKEVREVRVLVAEIDGKARASVQLFGEDGKVLVVIGAEETARTDTKSLNAEDAGGESGAEENAEGECSKP